MKIVAVTACPTGIAHTYMAAEQLEQVGKRLGHTVKVETQGALGIEAPLSDQEILEADAVILAADVVVRGRERFTQKALVLEIPLQQVIRHPADVFARLAR